MFNGWAVYKMIKRRAIIDEYNARNKFSQYEINSRQRGILSWLLGIESLMQKLNCACVESISTPQWQERDRVKDVISIGRCFSVGAYLFHSLVQSLSQFIL